jgi:hypothetical protein
MNNLVSKIAITTALVGSSFLTGCFSNNRVEITPLKELDGAFRPVEDIWGAMFQFNYAFGGYEKPSYK